MEEEFGHRPVLADEVVAFLAAVPTGVVVDGTVGGAGHARLILDSRADLRVLGIDRDGDAVEAARRALEPYGARATVVRGGFEDVAAIVATAGEGSVSGMLLDLGVSSWQLDRGERGFSYFADAPLDMRMDNSAELTAAIVVNTYDEDELARVLFEYGEERFARQIAARIVAARPLETTGELVALIKDAIPAPARRTGPHPARRTFQALRMEVNRELEHLDACLDESVHLLTPGGRMAVISYHSLEDRIVKDHFTEWSRTTEPVLAKLPVEPVRRRALTRLLTRKPVRPSEAEIATNPRARSARLRVVERLS